MRIAIADDDPELLKQLSAAFESTRHRFEHFRDGSDLQHALKRDTFDVVLVDWNIAGHTGIGIVEWALRTLEHPPAFILTASRAEKADIVRGFEAGAVDYIARPENGDVIRARIEAANRKFRPSDTNRHAIFGDYEIDRLLKKVSWRGEDIKLTAKEFDLVTIFFDNLNRPLSRAYLFGEIWGGGPGIESRTLDIHLSRIRSKLRLTPQNGFAIQTVFGFGYRMDRYGKNSDDN